MSQDLTISLNQQPPVEPQMVHKGWIGVDLDGTLAHYDKFVAVDHIGEPIPAMLEFVKRLLDEGEDVRIFTARISPATLVYNKASKEEADEELNKVVTAIVVWCHTNLGRFLPIAHSKDFMMKALYDDRAIQIVPNEGRRADGLPL